MRPFATLGVSFLLLVLAGCSAAPVDRKVVNFGDVSDTQGGAAFDLEVRVIGLSDAGQPIEGALLGAALGAKPVAKAITDKDGIGILHVRSGQTIRIVAKADGWTTEESGLLHIGDVPKREYRLGCQDRSRADPDLCPIDARERTAIPCPPIQPYGVCPVTADYQNQWYNLTGTAGSVVLALFPDRAHQIIHEIIPANVNTPDTVPPTSDPWFEFGASVQREPYYDRMQMMRFSRANSTIEWHNEFLGQADFEFGVGCHSASWLLTTPPKTSSGQNPHILQQGPVRISLDYSIYEWGYEVGRWVDCHPFMAGPVTETVNTPVPITITNELHFAGRGTIVPIDV
ncbi:MAG TPA: hypothetical protein VGB18_09480 [Candidatus Thermoplasmatota archaeon]